MNRAMEKSITPKKTQPEPLDLSSWRSFQSGLSSTLEVPVSLYDSAGNLLSSPPGPTCLCREVRSTPEGRARCDAECRHAVTEAISQGKFYIHKCHTNQYIFAVPIEVDHDRRYAVVGGHVYLAGFVDKDFYPGVAQFGLDQDTVEDLRRRLRTIPPRSIFTLPAAVNDLVAPFIRCLHARAAAEKRSLPEGAGRPDGLKALEGVYTSIAPVLNREELYRTILDKSAELVSADSGSLMILDSESNLLQIKAARGLEPALYRSVKVRVGEGISGVIASRGIPLVVKNIEEEVPERKNRQRYRTKSFMSVPLKLDSRVIGVLNISDKHADGVFSEEDLHLILSVANFASIALERGAYYSMTEELKMISMTDPLTGLFNRRYFRERLYEEVERVKRHNECFSTFIIDIDNFKSFNDTYGHQAGDEILKGVSRAIRDAVRSMDVVARYGGEEFAVLLPHTNKQDSFVIAERIRKDVEGYRPKSVVFKEWPTISLGLAEYPYDASTIDELIDKADRAMYIAKQMGKNRVVVYER